MDDRRFDLLVRSFATASRRRILQLLASGTLGASLAQSRSDRTAARQASLPCPTCLPCEVCDPSIGRCVTRCRRCQVCDPDIGRCRGCAACEVCDRFTQDQCVPQCGKCETCDPVLGACRNCDPRRCETCDLTLGGCRTCQRCEKCDPNSGQCLPTCKQCERCDPVLGICRGCDKCRCEECDPSTGECRGCDATKCQRCDPSSGRCVEGCSPCERCDPSTGACLSGCGSCRVCDRERGECRDCLPCEKCDEQTGACISACDQCQVCDPERGECRECSKERCETCDKETGQCVPLCCPGQRCEPRQCDAISENCLDFAIYPPGDAANPRPESIGTIPAVFDIFWPPGRPAPPYVRALRSRIVTLSLPSGATVNGLETGFRMTITLLQPVTAIELSLTHTARAASVEAFAGQTLVDTAAMNPAFAGVLETLRLEGSGIDFVVVTAPQDETYLTTVCACPTRC